MLNYNLFTFIYGVVASNYRTFVLLTTSYKDAFTTEMALSNPSGLLPPAVAK